MIDGGYPAWILERVRRVPATARPVGRLTLDTHDQRATGRSPCVIKP